MDVMPWEVSTVWQVPAQATDLSNEYKDKNFKENPEVKPRDKGPEHGCAGDLQKHRISPNHHECPGTEDMTHGCVTEAKELNNSACYGPGQR